MSMFKPATRSAAKARIALAGPSGSGKTYTGLALACALADRVAVVDTERGSASKYVGLNGWAFDTVTPDSFSPTSLVELLAVAGGEGYGCILIDSLSHYWMGVGGMLEQVDRLTRQSRSQNAFSAGWKEARPEERKMIDALVSYPGHVIVTLRVKTEYVIEEDHRGKKVPRKVGLKPEQREGLEYEFDVVGDLELDNTLIVSKSRIPMLSGAVVRKPGPELAKQIGDWLSDGSPAPAGPLVFRDQAVNPAVTRDDLLKLHEEVKSVGLLHAAVTDADGHPMTLGDLIIARGKALAPKPVQGRIDPKGAQRATIEELLTLRGFGTSDGLEFVCEVAGRWVGHVKELSPDEAVRVIERLDSMAVDESKETA